MNFIVRTHVIPAIWHAHRGKDKKQVRLELNMYFDKLMYTVTITHLKINIDIVNQYVFHPATLKMMMHMLSNELDRGAISVSIVFHEHAMTSMMV